MYPVRFDNPENGTDGWTVFGDGSAPVYQPAGGNPGGHITTTDQALGTIAYWVAPAKFLGDKSAAFGGTLTFDLRQDVSGSQFSDQNPLVRLVGNGITLSLAGSGPATSFTSYSTPALKSGGGWTSGGSPASDAEIQNVLANLTEVRIRAEFAFVAGDVDDLDNVILHSAVPEPSTVALSVVGLSLLGLARVRARSKGADSIGK